MNGRDKVKKAYLISLDYDVHGQQLFTVSFVPRGLQQERRVGEKPKPVSQYKVVVQLQGDEAAVTWQGTQPSDPQALLSDFEQEAVSRAKLLADWFGRLSAAVAPIRRWATELGWSTRWI